MKFSFSNFLALAVIVGPFANNARAVTVKNCPQTFRSIVSGLRSTKTAEDFANDNADENKLELIAYYLKNDLESASSYRTWTLNHAADGHCRYTSGATGNEKAEIYTTKGKDIVYLQTDLSLKGIVLRVYGGVESLSPKSLVLKSEHASVALGIPRSGYEHYSAGGALVFFGTADKIEIKGVIP